VWLPTSLRSMFLATRAPSVSLVGLWRQCQVVVVADVTWAAGMLSVVPAAAASTVDFLFLATASPLSFKFKAVRCLVVDAVRGRDVPVTVRKRTGCISLLARLTRTT
jgi:hypothetical protein